MDFVERLFGISPDGGSGLFELAWLMLPLLAFTGLYVWSRRRVYRKRAVGS